MQDIYYNFALPGDHYVGRILAGLDPSNTTFRVLPPHFTCGLENPYIKEAMELCYGKILKSRKNLDFLPGIFLLFLASIVYHETWLKNFILHNKKHAFSNLFILQNTDLLQNLKKLVTIEPTDNMSRPTGVPTHISLEEKMDRILLHNIDFLDQLKAQTTVIREAIKEAIQENDLLSGTVTMPILTEKLDGLQTSIIKFIQSTVGKISNNNLINDENTEDTDITSGEIEFDDNLQRGSQKAGNPIYCYSGHFWEVPKGFKFPKNPTRKVGWEYWLKGQPMYEVLENGTKKVAPVKPFRKLDLKKLPVSEKGTYSQAWTPIYEYMEKAPGLTIPKNPEEITAAVINETFDIATEYMKERVSYIWKFENRAHANWSISTWSKHVTPSYIKDLGTDEDKLYLPAKYRTSRKKNKSKSPVPIEIEDTATNNNKRKNDRTNTDNSKQIKISNSSGTKTTSRSRQSTIRTHHTVPNLFNTFTPDAIFMEQARESINNESEMEVVQVPVQPIDRLTMNSTDPSLLVQVPTEGHQIQNASRTTMASFTATITTILDAAAAAEEDPTK